MKTHVSAHTNPGRTDILAPENAADLSCSLKPERLAAYRKSFQLLSTAELRAIVEGRKGTELTENSLEAMRLLLDERQRGRGEFPGSDNSSRGQRLPDRERSQEAREVVFKQLPDYILSVREFMTCYRHQLLDHRTRTFFKLRPVFQLSPDFSEEAKERMQQLLSENPSRAVAYAKASSGNQEVVFLEDSIVIQTAKAALPDGAEEHVRIPLRTVRSIEMKLVSRSLDDSSLVAGELPELSGELLIDEHILPDFPITLAHLFAQLVARLSSGSYNVARFAKVRYALSQSRKTQENLFETWQPSLLKVLPGNSTTRISAADLSPTAFAGISWRNIADIHTYTNTKALSIALPGGNRDAAITILTVEGEKKTFRTPSKNLPLLEAYLKECAGMSERSRSTGATEPESPQSLIEDGRSQSRALGYSMIIAGILAMTVFTPMFALFNPAESFAKILYVLAMCGLFSLLGGIRRVIWP